MDTKKILLIGGGVLLAIYILLNILKKEEKYSNSFAATRPEVIKTEYDKKITMNMVVDASISMRGYTDFPGLNVENLNFVSNVCNLLTSFESKFKSNSTVYCANNKYNTVEDFSKELNRDQIFNSNASEIDKLISKCIKEQVCDSSVCVIVSDMVLSYGLTVLMQKGENYNLVRLDGLGHAIYNAATKAKDKGYDIMIMKYTSDFNGKYYCNCTENSLNRYNPYKNNIMKNRPYYIMLIGKREDILNVYENCVKGDEELYTSFEIEEGKETEEITIKDDGKKHYWLTGDTQSSDVGVMYTKYDLKDKTTEFGITYDNFVLPKYIKAKDLSIEATENFSIKEIEYKNNILNFTLVTPAFDKMGAKNDVVITVSYKKSTDWESISIKNDVDQPIDSLEGKTWAISTIFKNIDKAYFENERPSLNQISTARIKFIKNN